MKEIGRSASVPDLKIMVKPEANQAPSRTPDAGPKTIPWALDKFESAKAIKDQETTKYVKKLKHKKLHWIETGGVLELGTDMRAFGRETFGTAPAPKVLVGKNTLAMPITALSAKKSRAGSEFIITGQGKLHTGLEPGPDHVRSRNMNSEYLGTVKPVLDGINTRHEYLEGLGLAPKEEDKSPSDAASEGDNSLFEFAKLSERW